MSSTMSSSSASSSLSPFGDISGELLFLGRIPTRSFGDRVINQARLQEVLEDYQIRAPFRCRIPTQGELPSTPGAREFASSEDSFECGFRVPMSVFVRDLLARFDWAPIQLLPNAWLFIADFVEIFSAIHVAPTQLLFRHLVKCGVSKNGGWTFLSFREGWMAPSYKDSHKGWRKRWFFVGYGDTADWDVPT